MTCKAMGTGRGSVMANVLFVVGLGMLWNAGFANAPVQAVSDGLARILALLAPGLAVAGIGVAEGMRRERHRPECMLVAIACVVALLGAASSWGMPAAGVIAVLDGVLDGTVFFLAIYLTLHYREIIADASIPLGFLAGSAFTLIVSALGIDFPHGAALNGAVVALLLCFSLADRAHLSAERIGHGPSAFHSTVLRRWAFLHYGALMAGAMALAFVFGVMTDLHGWMASASATSTAQVANMAACVSLAIVFALYRRPFRVDGALAVVLPLFAAALLSLPAEPGSLSFSRLAIMVGYLLLFVIAWVLVKRERRQFAESGMIALALTVGALLAFAQIGRFIAAAMLGMGGLTSEALSALALGFFWLVILLAGGAYWLARTRAVERDLAMLETTEDREKKTFDEADSLKRPDEHVDDRAVPVASSFADATPSEGASADEACDVVYVDSVAVQVKRLATRIGLSAREVEVLEEFARGRSAAFIAEKLFISPNTVKTHLRRIYEKAGIHSRQELLDMMEEA